MSNSSAEDPTSYDSNLRVKMAELRDMVEIYIVLKDKHQKEYYDPPTLDQATSFPSGESRPHQPRSPRTGWLPSILWVRLTACSTAAPGMTKTPGWVTCSVNVQMFTQWGIWYCHIDQLCHGEENENGMVLHNLQQNVGVLDPCYDQ